MVQLLELLMLMCCYHLFLGRNSLPFHRYLLQKQTLWIWVDLFGQGFSITGGCSVLLLAAVIQVVPLAVLSSPKAAGADVGDVPHAHRATVSC